MTYEMIFRHYKELLLKDGFPINEKAYFGGVFTSKRVYGLCTNKIKVTINNKLPMKVAPVTIIHELIHTIKGTKGHDKNFKYYASKVSKMYNINIDTHATKEEVTAMREVIKPKYIVMCTKCKKEWAYFRKAKVVKNPSHYHCQCGGTIQIKNT